MLKKGKRLHFKQPKTGDFVIEGFKVIISHPLSTDIDLKYVFSQLRKSVPSNYYQNLDYIYIGEFSFLKQRDLTALYKDQVFYISNNQDNAEDLIDDLIHETAHLVEEDHGRFIYEDNKLSREFLAKRKELYSLLDSQSELLDDYTFNYSDFLNPEYDVNFDNFLYSVVGYEHLVLYTMNIFYSPYAVTSLREYFANGFEAYYYHRDVNKLKNLSPILYNKIVNLEDYRCK